MFKIEKFIEYKDIEKFQKNLLDSQRKKSTSIFTEGQSEGELIYKKSIN